VVALCSLFPVVSVAAETVSTSNVLEKLWSMRKESARRMFLKNCGQNLEPLDQNVRRTSDMEMNVGIEIQIPEKYDFRFPGIHKKQAAAH